MSINLLTQGADAPEFQLLDQKGQEHHLTQYRGQKVVIYFYPKAMTPGCTTQACGIRDAKKELEQKNAVVLGISPDEPERLQKFEDKQQLNFTLLSDPEHKIAEAYGVWGLKKFMGKEYDGIHRVTYIVDEQGKIAHVMAKVNTKSHHDDVLALL